MLFRHGDVLIQKVSKLPKDVRRFLGHRTPCKLTESLPATVISRSGRTRM